MVLARNVFHLGPDESSVVRASALRVDIEDTFLKQRDSDRSGIWARKWV